MQQTPEQQRRLAEAWEGRISPDQLTLDERRLLADAWEKRNAKRPAVDPMMDIGHMTGDSYGGQTQGAAPPRSALPGAAGVRDALRDQMTQSTGLGPVPDAVARFGLGLGASVADLGARPVEATQEALRYTAETPYRLTQNLADTSYNVRKGNFRQAGVDALETVNSGLETALLVAPGAGSAAAKAARPVRSNPVLEAAERSGVELPPVAATQSDAAKALTKSISENTISGSGVRQNVRRSIGQAEDRLDEVAAMYSDATPRRAGEAAQEGVAAFDQRAGRFYAKFEDSLPEAFADQRVEPTATIARLRKSASRFDSEQLQELFDTPIGRKLRDIIDPPKQTEADKLLSQVLDLRNAVRPSGGKSLAQFIVERGGIRDDRGDVLDAMGGTVRGRPGMINRNGEQIDDLIMDAVETGYFPEFNLDQGFLPSRAQFLEAIDEDFRGRKRFADQDGIGNDRILRDAELQFDRMGIDVRASRDDLVSQVEQATGQQVTGAGEGISADLTYNDLRQLRTEVRRAQAKPGLAKTENDFELERLEGVLTEDIYRAVGDVAGARSLALMKRADLHYAGTKRRLEQALKPFTAGADKTPEAVFRDIVAAMQSQTTRSGRGDFKRIRDLRKALSKEQMDDVAGAVLSAAGRAKEADDFSILTLRTNWRNMGEQQKNIMFGGAGTARRQALDDLMVAVEGLADIEGAANFSRSGVSAQNMLTIGGFGVNPAATASALLAQGAAGRILSNPKHTRVVTVLLNQEKQAVRLALKGQTEAAARLVRSSRARAAAAIAAMEDMDMEVRQAMIESLAANDNQATSPSQQASSTQQPPPPPP